MLIINSTPITEQIIKQEEDNIINKKIYLLEYLKNPNQYSKEIQNVFKIILEYYETSEKIIGYNPQLRLNTFLECRKFLPNYFIGCVAEHDGVQKDSISIELNKEK